MVRYSEKLLKMGDWYTGVHLIEGLFHKEGVPIRASEVNLGLSFIINALDSESNQTNLSLISIAPYLRTYLRGYGLGHANFEKGIDAGLYDRIYNYFVNNNVKTEWQDLALFTHCDENLFKTIVARIEGDTSIKPHEIKTFFYKLKNITEIVFL